MSAPIKRPSIPASVVRGASQRLVRAARAAAPQLRERIAWLAGPEVSLSALELASMNAVRRDILARLEVDAWLMPSPEALAALCNRAIELTLVLPDDDFESSAGALASAIQADESIALLNTQDWRDWPTYAGIDLLLAPAGAEDEDEGGRLAAPRLRLRLQTRESLAAVEEMEELYASVRERRPRAERVEADFVAAPDLEVYYFLDLLPEIGHDLDAPAGLFCLLTTEAAQVGCHWDGRGWKPSAEAEYLVVTADPGLLPVDQETAEALGAFSPTSGLR